MGVNYPIQVFENSGEEIFQVENVQNLILVRASMSAMQKKRSTLKWS